MAKSNMVPGIFRRFISLDHAERSRPTYVKPVQEDTETLAIGDDEEILDAEMATATKSKKSSKAKPAKQPYTEPSGIETAGEKVASPDAERVTPPEDDEPITGNVIGEHFGEKPALVSVVNPSDEKFTSIANSWNIRVCERTVATLYGQLKSVIDADPFLSEKISHGFIKSLDSRKDINAAVLLNTAFRSGLKLRASHTDEEGLVLNHEIKSMSSLSSLMFAITDGERMRDVVKKTNMSKTNITKAINSPGKASVSTVIRVLDAADYSLSFEPA